MQLLLNYGPIAYLPFAFPVMWHMDRHGIRGTVLVGIALVVASNVMRCFANDASVASIAIVHVSFMLNGIAGPVAMAVPSKLAEDWFARDERTTATAIAALGNQSGNVFLYLLIPLLVPDTSAAAQLHLNLFLAALSIANAAMFAFYFPSHPPRAPTASARVSRSGEAAVTLASLRAALESMSRNAPYVLLTAVYSLIVGFSNCVGSMLTANLQGGLGLSSDAAQVTAGWVGAAGNGGSIVMGVALAAVTDRLRARSRGALKAVLVGACAVCGLAFSAYAAALSGALPVAKWGVGGLAVVGGAFTLANVALGALIPLVFDCCAEQTWPLPEGSMLMTTTFVMNAVSLVVLFAPAASFFAWANWATAAMALASALALWVVLPTTSPRYEYDCARAGGGAGAGDDYVVKESLRGLLPLLDDAGGGSRGGPLSSIQ